MFHANFCTCTCSHELTQTCRKYSDQKPYQKQRGARKLVCLTSLFPLLVLAKLASIPRSYIVMEPAFLQSSTLAIQGLIIVVMRKLSLPD